MKLALNWRTYFDLLLSHLNFCSREVSTLMKCYFYWALPCWTCSAPIPYYSNGNSTWKFNDTGRIIRRRVISNNTTFRQVFSTGNFLQMNNFNAQLYRNFWILQLDDWGKGDKEQCSLLFTFTTQCQDTKPLRKTGIPQTFSIRNIFICLF